MTTYEAAVTEATARTPRRTRRPALPGGVGWIVVVGALLAGIVAINVLVLQLNMSLDALGRQRAELQADNARLRGQLSSASATVKIAQQARDRLGLRPADPLLTEYLTLRPGER
jgi:cell division protein FtsL